MVQGGGGRRLSKMWQSNLILMFAHIAIIDLSLFSGVRVHKTWQEARRGMCLINKNTAAFSEHFSVLSVCGGPAGHAQMRGPDATLLLQRRHAPDRGLAPRGQQALKPSQHFLAFKLNESSTILNLSFMQQHISNKLGGEQLVIEAFHR